MKKRLLALILSALLLMNAVACNTVHVPENGDGTLENTDTETETENEKDTEEVTKDTVVDSTTPSTNADNSHDSRVEALKQLYIKDGMSTFHNFISRQVGYFFVFIESGRDTKLLAMYKTTDSGQTWEEQELKQNPSVYRKEKLVCVKMADENVGLIGAEHYSDGANRTFITKDGGKTWLSIRIPYPQPRLNFGEAYDIAYQNGNYLVTYRYKVYNNSHDSNAYSYVYLTFVSSNLESWTCIN